MFQKFFKLKSGADQGEPGSIQYCMDNPTAKVVRGDPDFTQWVIDHTPAGLKQRFTSGVITNREALDPVVKCSMLDGFENLMLAGRHECSMALCMIDHEDKGKYETHFVAPFFDLMFGKLVHSYIDQIDRNRFAAWVEWFALQHNLEHANDKPRVQPAFNHMRLPKEDAKFLRRIWEMVHEWTDDGSVTCRQDLQRKFAGTPYNVNFLSKHDRPLQQPEIIGPSGNKLRLTNSIYYRLDYSPGGPITLDRADEKAVKKRLEELQKIIREGMEFRAHHLIGRLFGRKELNKVQMGKAHRRLGKLIAEKRERDFALDAVWKKLPINKVLLGACSVEYGIPLPHFLPNMRLLAPDMSPIEPDMVTDQIGQHPVPEKSTDRSEIQPEVPLSGAQPLHFQAAEKGTNTVIPDLKDANSAASDQPATKPVKPKQQAMDDSPNMP